MAERLEIAFPVLSPEQLAFLNSHGTNHCYEDGEALWRAGDVEFCFFVVNRGKVEIVESSSGVEKHVVDHGPGEFTGDIDLLSGRPSIVSGISRGRSEILVIPPEELRRIIRIDTELGDIFLRAFLVRREMLLEQGLTGYRLVGSRYSADTQRIREFLARNQVPFTWLDLERNPEVDGLLKAFHLDPDETPVVILNDGSLLRNPTNAELATQAGISRPLGAELYDVVIIGAGPAGLAAGVYGASEGLRTLLLDSTAPGGQAGTSSKIENYMGFPMGISGDRLASQALLQAEKFGASLSVPSEVEALECGRGVHQLKLSDGQSVEARAVVIATGAHYRKLDIPDYDKFERQGIYYAATQVEAQLCSGSDVVIVGAGNSAGQAAVFLSHAVRKVWVVVRGGSLDSSMSSYLARRIEALDNVEVLTHSQVTCLYGDQSLEAVTVTGPEGKRNLSTSAMFVFIGAVPQSGWCDASVARDNRGFILTGPQVQGCPEWAKRRPPMFLETSCPGVFAAGDVRSGSIKRVASAVGEGAMAIAFVHQYLAEHA